ncbi:MAG: hypothetical protein CMJ49_10890 [Planctomycetaceae bacterium]|nr:hypothetical protein [Planctomycetaceae bacterium]
MPKPTFIKDPTNPIITPEPGTWKHDRCTSVTIAFHNDRCYFYHDGGIGFWWNGVPGFNWIGLLTCDADQFDGKTFTPFIANPILTHGRFCDIDRLGMISPRVHIIDNQFYLYYCAVSYEHFEPGKVPTWRKAIGLAISDDGINFQKVSRQPVVKYESDTAAGCPKLYRHDNRWHMLTNGAPIDHSAGFRIYLQTSDDPRYFDAPAECVFAPGPPGSWDCRSLAAPAFCFDEDDGYYYMLYGGCDEQWDYPASIGLARSNDLRHWQRHPDNPIIHRGEPGAWDDGAIWVTEFIKHQRNYYAWYEGRSAGRDRTEEYSPHATKQIGLLTSTGPLW